MEVEPASREPQSEEFTNQDIFREEEKAAMMSMFGMFDFPTGFLVLWVAFRFATNVFRPAQLHCASR